MTANQVCCLMSLFSNGLSPQGTSILYQLHLQLLLTIWTQGICHFHSWLLFRSQHRSLLGCNFQNQVRFDSISKGIFKFFHNFPNLYVILCSTYIFIFLFTDCWVWGFWQRVFLVSSHIFSWAKTLKHLNFVCIVPLKGRPLSTPDQVLSCNRKSTGSWSRQVILPLSSAPLRLICIALLSSGLLSTSHTQMYWNHFCAGHHEED